MTSYKTTIDTIRETAIKNHPALKNIDVDVQSEYSNGVVLIRLNSGLNARVEVTKTNEDVIGQIVLGEIDRLADRLVGLSLKEMNSKVPPEVYCNGIYGITILPSVFVNDDVLLCSFGTAEKFMQMNKHRDYSTMLCKKKPFIGD